MRRSLEPDRWLVVVAALLIFDCDTRAAFAQSSRKPIRVEAPVFTPGQFEGIFFDDAISLLQGELPSSRSTLPPTIAESSALAPAHDSVASSLTAAISQASLEDLVKEGKLRLDQIVTTPAAFKGGAFVEARAEFSLQAVLFAIIESYPGEVRWKRSAPLAREQFARVAAQTNIGSDQAFQEAKLRTLELAELVSGSSLSGEAKSEIEWSNLIDRVPMMQLLDWAHEKNLAKLVASEREFRSSADAVQCYAELICVLGTLALTEEMPDATDDDYVRFAKEMTAQAQQVVMAAKAGDADLARRAGAQIGQTCTNCHDSFR